MKKDIQISNKYLFLLVFMLMVFATSSLVAKPNVYKPEEASQQEIEVSGKVTDDENGEPLPGVNIVVEGTTMGTTTDMDGNYTIEAPADATLVFSFVGYQEQTVEVNDREEINIAMQQAVTELEEVVAIGYGTAKRRDLTGSVSRMDDQEIEKMVSTQITESLSGTVAGLYTTQGTDAAGGGSWEMRGPTTLAASSSPLVVVDGAIYSGSLRDINPDDIESIDVLKDASSTAVYGSKAAAGVIEITTKKGQEGKPTINFSAEVGASTTTNDLYPYGMGDNDPFDYFKMHRDLKIQEAEGDLPYYYYHHPDNLPDDVSTQEWLDYGDSPADDPQEEWFTRIAIWPEEKKNFLEGKTTNFYDLVVGNHLLDDHGKREKYNVSIDGGTENSSYFWSLQYLNNEGLIKGDEFSAVRTRMNYEYEIADWLSAGSYTQLSFRDESVVEASLWRMAYMSPYGSMWNEDGSLKFFPNDYTMGSNRNPFTEYYGQDRLRNVNTISSQVFAEAELPLGITYEISFQPYYSFTKDFGFHSSDSYYGRYVYSDGYGTRSQSQSFDWMVDNIVKWNEEIGEHQFDVTLLANFEQDRSWYSNQSAHGFAPNEKLGYNALQFGSDYNIYNNDVESTGEAYMARLNYTLMEKYLFTGTIRRDGFSAFGQKHPYATFPSLAFSWRLHEEGFYNSSWMNRLKLRLSWGESGNRSIGTYSALADMASIDYYDGENIQKGVYNTTLANPNLRWERTESYNIGFDIGLFEDRIGMNLDAYYQVTTDLLLNRDLPRITGYNSITSNLGELANRGFEATINSNNINTENFNWNSTVVYSANRNEIVNLWGDYGEYTLLGEEREGELPDYRNEWFPGYSKDAVWSYERLGIWQSDEAEEAAEYGLRPGDYKVEDVNEDGKYTEHTDKQFIGHTTPRHRLGIENTFSYKNLSASVFIRADIGNIRQVPVTGGRSTFDRRNSWGFEYWSRENPGSKFAAHKEPMPWGRYGGDFRVYEPSGFFRVQDVNLSYNIPADKLQGISSLRFTLKARNLFTITNWVGFDPESGMSPMPKTITLGVNMSL